MNAKLCQNSISPGCSTKSGSQLATSNPAELARMLDDHHVTVMQATPTTWRMLVDAGWQGSDGLVIGCGGERLDTDLSAALIERSDALWNLYGPTETTIWSSTRRIVAPGRERHALLRVGRGRG